MTATQTETNVNAKTKMPGIVTAAHSICNFTVCASALGCWIVHGRLHWWFKGARQGAAAHGFVIAYPVDLDALNLLALVLALASAALAVSLWKAQVGVPVVNVINLFLSCILILFFFATLI